MPVPPERIAGRFSPKWLVAGVALATFAMLMSYDWRLGMAAGSLLGVTGAMWMYLAVRYGSLSGASSGRTALVAQVRARESNRRNAAARSGLEQGADPFQRP
ncbi:hypothetical protein [Erythrobacter sp. R86502]|uniref:hypothetical protein n=1 Tax=Erythrobacter sp. R86502 TaxID=3093846 RepID=UPI0036D37B87